jgi:hypothetical protein
MSLVKQQIKKPQPPVLKSKFAYGEEFEEAEEKSQPVSVVRENVEYSEKKKPTRKEKELETEAKDSDSWGDGDD